MAGVDNGTLILTVIVVGFILVTIMMQLVGKKFTWHKELD